MNRPTTWLAAGACVAALAAGCGSSKTTTATSLPTPTSAGSSTPATTAVAKGSGQVSVLYAGSLVNLMQKQIGPALKSATGYSLEGVSAGSTALAAQIKSKVHAGDVFVSASPDADTALEGASNGNWVSWYATFATAPLVLGYNPSSKFASDIKTMPWYQAITQSGILVGRTDPATDPKGKLTATALKAAATAYPSSALTALSASTSGIYPEETLVGRLQAGQLDAGFFYSSEAKAADIPTVAVTLPGQTFKATFTVTILANAPDQAGAEAFVAYLLGPQGLQALQQDGFTLVSPIKVTGTGVPSSVQSVLSGS